MNKRHLRKILNLRKKVQKKRFKVVAPFSKDSKQSSLLTFLRKGYEKNLKKTYKEHRKEQRRKYLQRKRIRQKQFFGLRSLRRVFFSRKKYPLLVRNIYKLTKFNKIKNNLLIRGPYRLFRHLRDRGKCFSGVVRYAFILNRPSIYKPIFKFKLKSSPNTKIRLLRQFFYTLRFLSMKKVNFLYNKKLKGILLNRIVYNQALILRALSRKRKKKRLYPGDAGFVKPASPYFKKKAKRNFGLVFFRRKRRRKIPLVKYSYKIMHYHIFFKRKVPLYKFRRKLKGRRRKLFSLRRYKSGRIFKSNQLRFLRLSRYRLLVNKTYNNTFLTINDVLTGRIFEKTSGGVAQLKGSKRSTYIAMDKVTKNLLKDLIYYRLLRKKLDVYLQVPFVDKSIKTIIRTFAKCKRRLNKRRIRKIKLRNIIVNNPRCHNGIRGSKKRRV